MKPLLLFFSICAASLTAESLGIDDWPNWRGPIFNGSTNASHPLPHYFDKSKGVKWKAQLPGPSAATPIVVGENVFVSSIAIDSSASSPAKGDLMALCFNRDDGALVWSHNAGSGYRPSGDGFDYKLDSRSNYASPSPVTDGTRVIYFFGNGDLVSYLMNGSEEWRRNIQKDYGDFCFQWTFSSSPTLHRGNFIFPFFNETNSTWKGNRRCEIFLLCMDP